MIFVITISIAISTEKNTSIFHLKNVILLFLCKKYIYRIRFQTNATVHSLLQVQLTIKKGRWFRLDYSLCLKLSDYDFLRRPATA